MADVTVWDILTAAGATGSFAVLCLLAARIWSGLPNFMDRWLALKAAKAAEKAADWARLRDLLKDQGEEIGRLTKAEKQCREDHAELHRQHMEVMSRLTSLEGYMAGQGKASQEAAGIVAIERMGRNDRKPGND